MREIRLHGPPGCGKTTALATRWVPDAVDRFGPEAVVICSLTKTAAEEIASRGVPIPRRNVGTLHALAYRGLGRPPLVASKLGDWNLAHPSLALSVGRTGIEAAEIDVALGATLGDKLLARMEIARHQKLPRKEWAADVAMFADRWEDWKEQEYLVDFTDLIELATAELPLCPGAPAVMIVDEAQDSSALELALVREWGRHTSFFVLAGDGDQAIYEWRGASAAAFYGGDLPEENNYHLTQSYRVPRAVHRVASNWIAQASSRYAVEYKPRDFDGQALRGLGSSRNTPQLVREIQADLNKGMSIMLLASCSFTLNGAVRQLKMQGEPFFNPYRRTNGRWNPLRGGAERLGGLLRPATDKDAPLWSWRELSRWVDLIRSDELVKGAKKTIKLKAAEDEERSKDHDGEREPSTTELRAILGENFIERLLTCVDTSVDATVEFIQPQLLPTKRKLIEYALKVVDSGAHRLTDTPSLIIGTIHSVKGGEADAVYLMPDLSSAGMREWLTPGKPRDSVLRLMYVGMTRAREKLVLCSPARSSCVTWPIDL